MSKKILDGKVIKDQNDKTIVVVVKRKYSHPFFGKVITSSKKYHAHDENNKFKIGDIVQIIESKPISKKKKWTLFFVISRCHKSMVLILSPPWTTVLCSFLQRPTHNMPLRALISMPWIIWSNPFRTIVS